MSPLSLFPLPFTLSSSLSHHNRRERPPTSTSTSGSDALDEAGGARLHHRLHLVERPPVDEAGDGRAVEGGRHDRVRVRVLALLTAADRTRDVSICAAAVLL